MLAELETQEVETLVKELHRFFPDCQLIQTGSEMEMSDGCELLYKKEQIISYLQEALSHKKNLEIQIDHAARTFFSQLFEDFPEDEQFKDESCLIGFKTETSFPPDEPECLLVAPLAPEIGNIHLLTSNSLLIRFDSENGMVELGCTFMDREVIAGVRLVRVSFPVIGKIHTRYRATRITAFQTVGAVVSLVTERMSVPSITEFSLVNISTTGLAFEIEEDEPFAVGDTLQFEVKVPGVMKIGLSGTIKHFSSIREKHKFRRVCGLQFDPQSASRAAELSHLAASVQRLQ